eukprot:1385296-Amphidinium_carterae.1
MGLTSPPGTLLAGVIVHCADSRRLRTSSFWWRWCNNSSTIAMRVIRLHREADLPSGRCMFRAIGAGKQWHRTRLAEPKLPLLWT